MKCSVVSGLPTPVCHGKGNPEYGDSAGLSDGDTTRGRQPRGFLTSLSFCLAGRSVQSRQYVVEPVIECQHLATLDACRRFSRVLCDNHFA
jgi:hypothetical protein